MLVQSAYLAHFNTRPATVLIHMINTQPRSTTNALYSHYTNPSCVHASVADYWFFGGRNVTIAISDITEFPRKFLIRIPWVPHLSTTSSHHMILLLCQVLILSVCALRLTSNGALLISQVCAGINLKFVYEGTRFILLMGVDILQLLFFLTVMFSLSFDVYFYSLSKKAICDAVTYCWSQQYLHAD